MATVSDYDVENLNDVICSRTPLENYFYDDQKQSLFEMNNIYKCRKYIISETVSVYMVGYGSAISTIFSEIDFQKYFKFIDEKRSEIIDEIIDGE